MTPDELAAAGRVLLRLVETPGPLETPCWIWPGSTSHGYGYVRVGGRKGKTKRVHRLMYRVFVREAPAHHHVHHECEQPLCANPAHLTAMTARRHVHISNSPVGRKARQTHCASGRHRLTRKNSGNRADGRRRCLACHRIRENARYHAARAA